MDMDMDMDTAAASGAVGRTKAHDEPPAALRFFN